MNLFPHPTEKKKKNEKNGRKTRSRITYPKVNDINGEKITADVEKEEDGSNNLDKNERGELSGQKRQTDRVDKTIPHGHGLRNRRPPLYIFFYPPLTHVLTLFSCLSIFGILFSEQTFTLFKRI